MYVTVHPFYEMKGCEDRESIRKKRQLLFALAFLIGISLPFPLFFLSGSIPDQYLVAEERAPADDPSSR